MLKTRERYTLILLVVTLLLVGALAVAGCQEADTEDTESTQSTAATETTEPAEDGDTTSTTGGETTTTAGGETTTTPEGGESPAPVSEQFRICTDCHADFNQFLSDPNYNVLTNNFSHGLHINKGYACEECHVVPTHQPDQIVVPPMQKCFTCHSQEENAIAPGECGACHPADFPLVPANHSDPNWLPPADPGQVATVQAVHSDLALEDPTYCSMCHAEQFCNDCHQTPMPHQDDWQAAHPQEVRNEGGGQCNRCHPDQLICNQCHHTGFQPGTPWTQQHPPLVQQAGAESCFNCHNPLTCAHCHITGEYENIEGPSGS
jgi:hypothetical protein